MSTPTEFSKDKLLSVLAELNKAFHLKAREAKALEKICIREPDNTTALGILCTYYGCIKRSSSRFHRRNIEAMLRLIDLDPVNFSTVYAFSNAFKNNRIALRRAKRLWGHKIREYPDIPKIAENAVSFFRYCDTLHSQSLCRNLDSSRWHASELNYSILLREEQNPLRKKKYAQRMIENAENYLATIKIDGSSYMSQVSSGLALYSLSSVCEGLFYLNRFDEILAQTKRMEKFLEICTADDRPLHRSAVLVFQSVSQLFEDSIERASATLTRLINDGPALKFVYPDRQKILFEFVHFGELEMFLRLLKVLPGGADKKLWRKAVSVF